jgi:hypothetical protein
MLPGEHVKFDAEGVVSQVPVGVVTVVLLGITVVTVVLLGITVVTVVLLGITVVAPSVLVIPRLVETMAPDASARSTAPVRHPPARRTARETVESHVIWRSLGVGSAGPIAPFGDLTAPGEDGSVPYPPPVAICGSRRTESRHSEDNSGLVSTIRMML